MAFLVRAARRPGQKARTLSDSDVAIRLTLRAMSHKALATLLLTVSVVVGLTPRLLAETPVGQFNGRPKFDEGKALGYFIWRDDDTWKVRWTTFGAERRFNGRVTLEGGEFRSF